MPLPLETISLPSIHADEIKHSLSDQQPEEAALAQSNSRSVSPIQSNNQSSTTTHSKTIIQLGDGNKISSNIIESTNRTRILIRSVFLELQQTIQVTRGIFTSLMKECETVSQRFDACINRYQSLESKMLLQVDSDIETTINDSNERLRQKSPSIYLRRRSIAASTESFTNDKLSGSLWKQYISLRTLNAGFHLLRDVDGLLQQLPPAMSVRIVRDVKSCQQLYSNPQHFFQSWKSSELKKLMDQKKGKKPRRTRNGPESINDPQSPPLSNASLTTAADMTVNENGRLVKPTRSHKTISGINWRERYMVNGVPVHVDQSASRSALKGYYTVYIKKGHRVSSVADRIAEGDDEDSEDDDKAPTATQQTPPKPSTESDTTVEGVKPFTVPRRGSAIEAAFADGVTPSIISPVATGESSPAPPKPSPPLNALPVVSPRPPPPPRPMPSTDVTTETLNSTIARPPPPPPRPPAKPPRIQSMKPFQGDAEAVPESNPTQVKTAAGQLKVAEAPLEEAVAPPVVHAFTTAPRLGGMNSPTGKTLRQSIRMHEGVGLERPPPPPRPGVPPAPMNLLDAIKSGDAKLRKVSSELQPAKPVSGDITGTLNLFDVDAVNKLLARRKFINDTSSDDSADDKPKQRSLSTLGKGAPDEDASDSDEDWI